MNVKHTMQKKLTDPDKYYSWKNNHDNDCLINHTGSSGSMEKQAAMDMFLRSIDKHSIRYTTFVGDGDTNSFAEVKHALASKYGDSYKHIQRRLYWTHSKKNGYWIEKFIKIQKGAPLLQMGSRLAVRGD